MGTLFFRKGVICTLFLLISCSSNKPPEWIYNETITGHPCFNSTRLFFPACNTFSEMDIEFIRTASDIRLYLDTHCLEIPVDTDVPSQVSIKMNIENQSSTIVGELLLGGQRIFLPPWEAIKIITALSEDKDVSLCVGQYHSTIPSYGFVDNYRKFCTR